MTNIKKKKKANRLLPEIKRRFNKIIIKRGEIFIIQNELNNILNEFLLFKNLFEKKKKLNEAISSLNLMIMYTIVKKLKKLKILVF